MPSTIDMKKREDAGKEERATALQDNQHNEVNGIQAKGKLVVPVMMKNGGSVQDAEEDGTKKSCEETNERLKQTISEFKARLKFLRVNDQVKELQTTLRDRYDKG